MHAGWWYVGHLIKLAHKINVYQFLGFGPTTPEARTGSTILPSILSTHLYSLSFYRWHASFSILFSLVQIQNIRVAENNVDGIR
jgi:hypothetical protein